MNPAVLTVTANPASMVYGASLPSFSAGYSGFMCSDGSGVVSGSPNLNTTATSCSGVNTYAITVDTSPLSAANYSFSPVSGTLTVTKATLTLTANATNRVYGAADPAFTGTYSGYQCSDNSGNVSVTGTPGFSANDTVTSAPGPYTITPDVSGLSSGNYSFTAATGTLTINLANAINTLVATPNPATPGTDVFLTNTVSAVAPATGMPSGTVVFLTNGVPLATNSLDGNGMTNTDTSLLPHGSNTVTVQYSGDANFNPATNSIGLIVDAAPVVPAIYTAGDLVNQTLTLSTVKLLLLASDADIGDTVTMLGAANPSTNGGTVSLSGDLSAITYTPALNYIGADRINYTITDGLLTSPGFILLSIANNGSSSNLVSAVVNNDNSITLNYVGIPTNSYHVQVASNLGVVPVLWLDLTDSTNLASTNGTWTYTDTNTSAWPQRYYRTVSP